MLDSTVDQRVRCFSANAILPILIVLTLYVGAIAKTSQDPPANSEPWPEQITPVPELPPPPDDLKELHETAKVEFVFYDPKRYRRRYAGETRFDLEYESRSDFRWRLVTLSSGKKQLVVRPRFDRLEISIKHRILLPVSCAGPNLYKSPLVRHEYDHVRISSDERYRRLLKQSLIKELQTIRVDLEPSVDETEFSEIAKTAIRNEAQRVLGKVMDLIQIRYAELDKETDHGSIPLSDQFFSNDSP